MKVEETKNPERGSSESPKIENLTPWFVNKNTQNFSELEPVTEDKQGTFIWLF